MGKNNMTQWFVKPIGKNLKLVKDMLMDELNRRGMNAEPQEMVDVTGKRQTVYQIASDMLNYLKKARTNLGIDFDSFILNPGSGKLVKDRFIYAANKKKLSKKALVAKKAAEAVKKRKENV